MVGGRSPPRDLRIASRNSACVELKAAACTNAHPRDSPVTLPRADWRSNTEALPIGINKHWRYHPRPHLLVLQGKCADDLLAGVFQPALIQAQGNVFFQLGGPGHGGNVPTAMAFNPVIRCKQDRTATQLLSGLQALDTNETPTLGRLQKRP